MERKKKASRGKDIDRIFAEGTLIDEALVAGVQEALRRHKQASLPIAEWRGGRTVWVPAEEIEFRDGDNRRAKSTGTG
jgi:hypothetical protein